MGSNRIASPKAACNALSSRAVCKIWRTTELERRSWFIATRRKAAHPDTPSAANARMNGHRFCTSAVLVFYKMVTGWMAIPGFGASHHAEKGGCNRVWVLMGPRRSQWEVLLWEGVVEEFEWLLHMNVARIQEHDAAQANEFPDQTLTWRSGNTGRRTWLC